MPPSYIYYICTAGAVGLIGQTFPVAEDMLVWLDGVGCSGIESRLAECPANPIGITYNCGRHVAAGVRCAAERGTSIINNYYVTTVQQC